MANTPDPTPRDLVVKSPGLLLDNCIAFVQYSRANAMWRFGDEREDYAVTFSRRDMERMRDKFNEVIADMDTRWPGRRVRNP